jgi:hypothetical protein
MINLKNLDYIKITTATGKNNYSVTREQDPVPKQELQYLVLINTLS